MSSFIHTIHEYIVLLIRYIAIFAVIGFMPIPLFTFFSGDNLAEIDHNPLFQYFNHYQITTDTILENVYTNVYISQDKNDIQQWEIDNAILWADAIAFKLTEEGIPVIREVITPANQSELESIQTLYQESALEDSLLPQEVQNLLLELKAKIELLLRIGSVTEDARQWIILALNSNEKTIKKEAKSIVSQFPNDNFLVITQTPVNLIKKTLQLALPDFNIKQAKRIISQGLKITQKQAEILLIDNKKSLWSLNNENGESPEISLKSILGKNYSPLNDFSDKEAEILKELCEEGKVKVGNKKLNLVDFGVIIKNKNYQWANEEARLNYQLHKETLCGKASWIDVEENEQIENDVNENQEKTETNENNQGETNQHGQNESDEVNQKEVKKSKKIVKRNEEQEQLNKGSRKSGKKSVKKEEKRPNQQNSEEKMNGSQASYQIEPESILLD